MEMIEQLYGPAYNWYQLYAEPEDVGHGGVNRKRTYCIGAHVDRTECLVDPYQLWEAVSADLRSMVRTLPRDYFLATKQEVMVEAARLAARRGKTFRATTCDLTYLLTEREALTAKALAQAYKERSRGRCAKDDCDLVAFLGDSATYSKTWSAASCKIPTFRTNVRSGLMWSFRHKRFLTNKEKLLCMGWPVVSAVSDSMQVPAIPALDIDRASALVGNGMHFGVVGVIQLIALCAFGPR